MKENTVIDGRHEEEGEEIAVTDINRAVLGGARSVYIIMCSVFKNLRY